MISRVARFPGSLMPLQYLVASAHKHSTGKAIWTDVVAGPPQRSQPSTSRHAVRPHSRLAELPRLFRSH